MQRPHRAEAAPQQAERVHDARQQPRGQGRLQEQEGREAGGDRVKPGLAKPGLSPKRGPKSKFRMK